MLLPECLPCDAVKIGAKKGKICAGAKRKKQAQPPLQADNSFKLSLKLLKALTHTNTHTLLEKTRRTLTWTNGGSSSLSTRVGDVMVF